MSFRTALCEPSTRPLRISWVQVKDQGQCGSCWAFSTTGVIEGANALASGKLVSLSEQVLVDCATNGNVGCQGGFPAKAAQWVINNGGIPTETHYEHYTPESFRCDTNRSAITDVHINKVLAVERKDTDNTVNVGDGDGSRPTTITNNFPTIELITN